MHQLLINRWFHVVLLLGLLGFAVSGRIQDHDWAKALRFLAFDSLNVIYPRPATDQVVIVDIDEISMAQETLGQWPWPRHIVADMVETLHSMGAKAIVFDMVFAEYDRTSPRAFLKALPEDHKTESLENNLSTLKDHDLVLAEAFKESGRVVNGFVWTNNSDATRRAPTLSKPIVTTRDLENLSGKVPNMVGVITGIPELSEAAAGNGSFGVSTEIDGLIRQVPLLFSYENRLYPSLAVEALRVGQDPRIVTKIRTRKAEELGLFDPPLLMQIGQYEIPMDQDGKFLVWFSKARSHDYLPAWRVLNGDIQESRIKDKIVLIGTSAEGLKDIRSTPLDLFIPGVEVHLNVVEQILTQNFLLRPAILSGVEVVFMTAIGLLIIALAPFIGAVVLALLTISLVGGIGFLSWYMFLEMGLLLDPVYPSLTILALFVLAALLAYIRTEAERKQVRNAFSHYISPDFMRELTSNPDNLRLGGEVKDLTVMFTDIRGFTSISEQLPPDQLIQLMNDFLTPMSALVMDHRGTIDKYMGDAMMAFWNAPLDDADHALHACMAALQMNQALGPINARLQAEGKDIRLQAGIGINTGPSSVGNMGSRQRFAYSALGDTVNLASRLEGQTKYYGVDILLGEDTAKAVQNLAVIELDLIRVKGKTEPERIYTILGDADRAAGPEFQAIRAQVGAMLEAYRAGDFDRALDLLPHIDGGMNGLEQYAAMMHNRIEAMKKHRPDSDWDGVYNAVDK